MTLLSFIVGLLVGFITGGVAAYLFARRSSMESERVAEMLSAKMIGKQTEQILQLAETKLSGKKELIDGSLAQMKTELTRVETLMREIGTGHARLDTRLGDAAKVIRELSETTGSLKTALASNSDRGQWGERMAEDVLRLSGLIENINYIKQRKLTGSDSKPDFTFLLPQNLRLNMDVKFPFNNYQLFMDATTDEERKKYKKDFINDVKKRIKEVQTRDYINPEDQTVDYVLLFIPNEQVFAFINEIDRSMIDEAMKGKTILCSPLSLYAILAVIRQSIDNFNLEGKSREMLSLFGAFKKQWGMFKDQMTTVQSRFEAVHKGYEELTGTRERQLDRQLTKIDELRQEAGIPLAQIGEAFDEVARENIEKTIRKEAGAQ